MDFFLHQRAHFMVLQIEVILSAQDFRFGQIRLRAVLPSGKMFLQFSSLLGFEQFPRRWRRMQTGSRSMEGRDKQSRRAFCRAPQARRSPPFENSATTANIFRR